MQVYFLAERKCILTLGGVVVGMVDTFERSVELEPDGLSCTLTPFGGYLPVSFRIDEDFFLSPPPEVALYRLGGERFALSVSGFMRSDQSLKILWQETVNGARLTLLRQGRLFLDLQTEAGFVLVPLDDALEGCRAAPQDDGFLLYTETRFCLISRAGEVLISSEGRVVETGARLVAEVPFHDSRGHAALCEWERGELAACSLKTALPPVPQTFALALFESVLLGLDPSPFLAPELDGDALREYLGEFVSVVLTDEENRVGLVYPRRERIYDVRYFTVETDGRRVVNIVAQ